MALIALGLFSPQFWDSMTRSDIIGSKKHSVLPEPVPVVTIMFFLSIKALLELYIDGHITSFHHEYSVQKALCSRKHLYPSIPSRQYELLQSCFFMIFRHEFNDWRLAYSALFFQ